MLLQPTTSRVRLVTRGCGWRGVFGGETGLWEKYEGQHNQHLSLAVLHFFALVPQTLNKSSKRLCYGDVLTRLVVALVTVVCMVTVKGMPQLDS